jgi:hypothetical protein
MNYYESIDKLKKMDRSFPSGFSQEDFERGGPPDPGR